MNSPGITKRALPFILLFFGLAVFHPLSAAHADGPAAPSATLSTDILSQYIFRGAAQSKGSAVIQPSFTVAWDGFSANIWGNFDTARHSNNPNLFMPPGQVGNGKWSETDLTVSYTRELCTNFSVLLGNVYYSLQQPLSAYDQDEVFGGVSYNFPWFTAAFTTYGEVTHTYDVWLELDLTKSIPVDVLCKGATLDLGTSFGYLILLHDNNVLSLNPAQPPGSYSDFHTCLLTADLKFPINKYLSVAPKVGLWLPLTDDASNFLQANSLDSKSTHFYGGVNLTATF